MAVYIGLFLLAVVLGILITGKNPTKKNKIIYLSIMFVLMFVVMITRYGIGNDYFSYMRIYNNLINSDWATSFTALGLEPLFVIITKLFSGLTHNTEILYTFYAVLILAPVAYAIYRHSDNVWLSVVTYLCFTFYYTSFNFIRQSMAVSVIILAYGFIKEKKHIPVIIMGIIATLIHFTAAVFIPLYLISLIKPTKKYLIIFSSASVGVLLTCIIMKAAGANPADLVAMLATVITGKNYSSYIGSTWFETGFSIAYIIMPLTFLGFVMISYFLGWKEKKEAPILLQFTLMNAIIWMFITYAFIFERFSMFIFIFSVFTVPSVLNYYKEKADAEEKNAQNAKEQKKMPGYSKKKSEEKRDNHFLLTIFAVTGMFVYNCWGMSMNFHGAFPYISAIPEIQVVIDDCDTPEENIEAMKTNADLYKYFIQLKESGCTYAILSTSDTYGGLTMGVRRAADYAGTGFNRSSDVEESTPTYFEYNNRAGEAVIEQIADETFEYEAADGTKMTLSATEGKITDSKGNSVTVADGKTAFILMDENGTIFDAMQFETHTYGRTAAKISIDAA